MHLLDCAQIWVRIFLYIIALTAVTGKMVTQQWKKIFSPIVSFLTSHRSLLVIFRLTPSLLSGFTIMAFMAWRGDYCRTGASIKPIDWESTLTSHNGEESQQQQQPPLPAVHHCARYEPGKVFTRMERPLQAHPAVFLPHLLTTPNLPFTLYLTWWRLSRLSAPLRPRLVGRE